MTNTWSSATGFCCIEPERKNWCGKTAYPVHQDSTCLPFRFFDHETIVLNRKEQLLFICRSKDICLPRYSANPIWTGMAISESRSSETTEDTWCSIAHVFRKRNCPENRAIENFKSGRWHSSRITDTPLLKTQTKNGRYGKMDAKNETEWPRPVPLCIELCFYWPIQYPDSGGISFNTFFYGRCPNHFFRHFSQRP